MASEGRDLMSPEVLCQMPNLDRRTDFAEANLVPTPSPLMIPVAPEVCCECVCECGFTVKQTARAARPGEERDKERGRHTQGRSE
jgi:hypothetical protein